MWEHRAVGLYSCGNIGLYDFTDVGTEGCMTLQMWERRNVGLYRCANIGLHDFTDAGT